MIQSGYFIAGLDKLTISLSPATIVVVLFNFVRNCNSLALNSRVNRFSR